MRGKRVPSLVLFATLGVGACAGCAAAGGPDGDTDGSPIDATSARESGRPEAAIADATGVDQTSGDAAVARDETGDGGEGDAAADESGPRDARAIDYYYDVAVLGDEPPETVADGAAAPDGGDVAGDAGSLEAAPDAGGGGVEPDAGGDATSAAGPDASPTGGLDASADAACGGCDGGFTCGSGGYCVASTGVPAFGHVYVVVMEEQSLSDIQASTSATYIPALIKGAALATDYTSAEHPSLPNYLELTSGGAQGVGCDCQPGGTPTCTAGSCSLLVASCDCPQAATHLGDELDSAGIQWREYAEGMGAPCNAGGVDAGAHFAVSHVPFLYYDDVYTTPGRCAARVRDYGDFAGDLAAGAYRFSLISPDACHDMQTNCSGNLIGDPILQGDDWLSTNVPVILATAGFGAGGDDVLFIVWEEAGTDIGTPPAPLIVASPLVRAGSTTSAAYGHASLLATIEDGLGVARLGASATAAPIADVWR